ncbi:SgcJ/EcaC family oxidoreductase [Ammoniphilus sp. 3BR4]|uniref:SgcJ/EcaC family oxidoreductase n=1 Tax=Ammoniphilus sp. 3BR4 TaxID=3158265 RepID=UPI0034658DA7
MTLTASNEIQTLYQKLIDAWNHRDAVRMAEPFMEEGELIGFDGSQAIGREEILSHLTPIFASHPTPPFVSIVKDIRMLSADIAILRAIVGMIPHGKSDLVPELNAHQTLMAVKKDEQWQIELFQNTPAQFHGRPELVDQMTEELRQLVK